MERTTHLTGSGGSSLTRLVRATADGAKSALRSMPRSRAFLLLAACLVLAVPAGLVLVEALAVGEAPTLSWALAEITGFPVTYAYVTLSTVAMVVVLGSVLGRSIVRARTSASTDPPRVLPRTPPPRRSTPEGATRRPPRSFLGERQ